MAGQADSLIAALDVGTTKVSCLIVERETDGTLRYRGLGLAPLVDGLSQGNVRDLDAVERAIRMAVSKAEKLAGQQIAQVYVSFHGGDPRSEIIEAEIDVRGRPVSDDDIVEVTAAARLKVEDSDGQIVLHALPTLFSFDGEYHPKPPLGLFGETLGAHLHVISVREGPFKNLEMAVRRAQLDVAAVFHAGYAAARATVTDSETRVGTAALDIGASHTDICLFYLGGLMHTMQLPDGVGAMTDKIMAALRTNAEGAELLKLRHGAAISEVGNAARTVDVTGPGGLETTASLADLTDLMETEYTTWLGTVSAALESAGFSGEAGGRVVLSGGGSQARRLIDLAEDRLKRQVRIAEPVLIPGMPENAHGPAFACLVGLALLGDEHQRLTPAQKPKSQQGPLAQLFGWMKETF